MLLQWRIYSFFWYAFPALIRVKKESLSGNIQVSVERNHQKDGIFFDIQVGGFVHATAQQTWAVLTDDDRLPEVVPDL